MNPEQTPLEPAKPTRREIVLRRLQETPNEWVPAPELAALAGCLNLTPIIWEIRATGRKIENMTAGTRPKKSWYRLVVKEEKT